jgi:methyl-accepting chemotaxis protein
VTNLVQDISSGSKHQARNVSEINLGLVQMNEITQQNALMAEESCEASLNLTAESENLKDTISRFKLVTKGAA